MSSPNRNKVTISRSPVLVLLATSLLGMVVGLYAQSQPQNNVSPQASDSSADASAKAAARKKKFDDLKRQLEDDGKSDSRDAESPAPGLLVSPAQVGMLVNEQQKFSVLDIQGHKLKEKPEWSLSNSYVANLVDGEVPAIVAKDTGTVILRVRLGNLTGEAAIKVYPGDKLPDGAIRWAAPQIPGYTTKQIVQAVPTAASASSSPTPKP